jgi:hypothetical protein
MRRDLLNFHHAEKFRGKPFYGKDYLDGVDSYF